MEYALVGNTEYKHWSRKLSITSTVFSVKENTHLKMALVLLLFYLFAVTSIRLLRKLVKVYLMYSEKQSRRSQTKMDSQNKKSFSVATRILKRAHY